VFLPVPYGDYEAGNMMQSKRDPRINPQPGDVLRDGPLVATVTKALKTRVDYDLTQPNHPSPLYRAPMHCHQTIKSGWRKWAKDAEVLHVAE
jgi:hypothetical protein